ncbi:PTS fructose transporter subunit IIB [Alicyclobacillaceae bacterium I2511]|nr:PTS fructose transporter subunit IIB [Alicyclobacillaceae bacterium I2511]
MEIVLARIDDRLIHGQVASTWSRDSGCNHIIVANDGVAQDELRRTLLIQVAPPGVKSHVLSVEKAIHAYQNPKYVNFKTFFLFSSPADAYRMVEGGVALKSINVGGMAFTSGKQQITKAVSVNTEDVNAFKKLHERGIVLEVRQVPSNSKQDLMELLQKEGLL